MKNSARPPVRAQFHPDALELIERYQVVPEGYDPSGAPLFAGITDATWEKLAADPDYPLLCAILMEDFPTFAVAVLKIWAKRVGRLLPFVFNRVQRLHWNAIAARLAAGQPLFFVILKARQLGASTLVNGWCYWAVWKTHDIEATLVVHEKPLAYSFMDRLRIFHEELPGVAGIRRTLRQPSKQARVPRDELYYTETRSKVSTVVAKKAEARGRSSPHYHLAEYGFYDKGAELLGAIMPQLPAVGTPARLSCSVTVESTPNGKNDFYDLWQSCDAPESEWEAKFYPWFIVEDEYSLAPPEGWEPSPERRAWAERLIFARAAIDGCSTITDDQLYWYEYTLETECQGDQDTMDREYPSDPETCFLLRSRSIFRDDMRYLAETVGLAEIEARPEWKRRDIDIGEAPVARGFLKYTPWDDPFLRRLPTMEQLRLAPEFVFDPKGPLWVWSPPQVGHQYVVGCDVAAGTYAGDYSCAQVIDVTEGRQVAELWYKTSPEEFTDDGVALCWWYNQAVYYPEVNSIGSVCMKRAKTVWHYPRVGREERWDEVALKEKKYGHYTTNESKAIMVSFLKYVVQTKQFAIASHGLLAEMSTFIETAAGDFEAQSGSHDDRVMAVCLALYCVRQSPAMLAKLSTNKHQPNPNQMTAMIFSAPHLEEQKGPFKPTAEHRMPPEVQALLDGQNILGLPWNPISGDGIDAILPGMGG